MFKLFIIFVKIDFKTPSHFKSGKYEAVPAYFINDHIEDYEEGVQAIIKSSELEIFQVKDLILK